MAQIKEVPRFFPLNKQTLISKTGWFPILICALSAMFLEVPRAPAQVFFLNTGKDFKQPANADPSVVAPLHWINSILQQNNSVYYEGMSVPQRTILVDIENTPGNVHTLTFSHQSAKASVPTHAYDFITSWDQAVAAAQAISECVGLLEDLTTTDACEENFGPAADAALCNSLRASFSSTASLPDAMPDPSIGGNVALRIANYEAYPGFGDRVIKIYGNKAFTGASTVVFNGYTGNDQDANYTLTWVSDSEEILIEMAGHLAAGTDPLGAGIGYGPGLGAASVSGGPYHFKLRTLDGDSLGSQDNQIKGADIQTNPCDGNPCDDGIACTIDECTTDCSQTPPTYTCTHTPDHSLCASDNNPCTDDACVVGTGCVYTPDDSNICGDNLFCNGTEVCLGGVCQGGPTPCNDGKACTIDTCNEAADSCVYSPNHSNCSDGLFCNGEERCNPAKGNAATGCQPGTPVNCNSLSNQCNVGVCEEATDMCVAQPANQGAVCNDGLFCSTGEVCVNGNCVGGPRDCSDGVGCTNDHCDEVIDACTHTANDSKCNDNLFCTGIETCHPTLGCQPGTNPCTAPCACDEAADNCDCNCPTVPCPPASECFVVQCSSGDCIYSPAAQGMSCSDDGIACTLDQCDGTGHCAHTADDNQCPPDVNPCTDTVCHQTAGCVNVPDDGNACTDGQFCTVDACLNGVCTPTPIICQPDGIDCTLDVCDEQSDMCVYAPDNGECAEDGNPCTDQVCDAQQGCISIPDDSNACDNGLFCSINDRCVNGMCIGDPNDCSKFPDVFCTLDGCDEVNNECDHTPQNGLCSNGLGCDGNETCDPINGCQPGSPVICPDDENACTSDVCNDPKGICKHVCEFPGITCPDDKVCECDDPGCLQTVPVVDDDCSQNPTVECEDVVSQGKFPQEYMIERTCTATNDCGNTATCSHVIIVDDTEPPVVTCPPDKTCECGQPCDLGEPIVTDNCDPDPEVTIEVVEEPYDCIANMVAGVTPPPTLNITRTIRASDGFAGKIASGNENVGTCTQHVIVDDTTPPAMTACPGDISMCPAGPFNFTPPTCDDSCGSCEVTCTRSDGQPLSDPAGPNGTTVTCIAEDQCGNFSAPCQTDVIINCTDDVIPTVSQWGLCVLALLLLCGAKIYFGSRQPAL